MRSNSRLKIHYKTTHLLEYLRFSGQSNLVTLYATDVAFSVKGATKIPTYSMSRLEHARDGFIDYSTLDQMIAYDIFLTFKYSLGFKWIDYRILGVSHVQDDLFILDVLFNLT